MSHFSFFNIQQDPDIVRYFAFLATNHRFSMVWCLNGTLYQLRSTTGKVSDPSFCQKKEGMVNAFRQNKDQLPWFIGNIPKVQDGVTVNLNYIRY